MPRRLITHMDATLGVLGLTAVTVLALAGMVTARELSSMLGVLAVAGLLARGIPTWVDLTSLERSITCLLAATLILGAIGSYNLDRADAPPSGVVGLVIVHRVLVILVCLAWPWLMGNTGSTSDRLAHYRTQARRPR